MIGLELCDEYITKTSEGRGVARASAVLRRSSGAMTLHTLSAACDTGCGTSQLHVGEQPAELTPLSSI